jgi:4-amino-4-deoxy-L-arabinose transferase-like glycosyltransferase
MGLGAALRLAAIGSVPAGLYQDEAFNGLDALRVLLGEHPLYFTANNGREPLFIYLASISIASLGRTVTAVRLPAALLGTLTIPATAALGSTLFNRRVGLLGSTVVAITFWPLHLSRVAFRAVGLPLFLALAVAAGWHGTRRDSRAWILTGGLLYGLAFYTYLPIYFTLPVLTLFFLYLWATGYKAQLRRAAVWFTLGTVVSLAPLASTILADPSILFGRASQVSILNPELSQGELWSTMVQHVGKGLGMFFWSGDTIPRHNLPGRPIFDPLIAPFFVIGALWAIRNWRRPAAALTVLWAFLMLAPTVLAEDTPHFLRGVGVLPMACLLPAVGMDRSWLWLSSKRKIGRWTLVALVVLILAASLALTLRDYWRYAADPLTGFAFQSAAVELAEEMENFEGTVWASDRFMREWESVPYLIGDRSVHWLRKGEQPRPASWPSALFLWPYEPIEPLLAALPTGISLQGWRGPLIKGDLEPLAYSLYWSYRLEPAAEIPEPVATFGDHISLGQVTVTPGSPGRADDHTLQVVLTWGAAERPELDYQIFVHVRGTAGVVAQDDSGPADGTLPATWWRPGDWIVDRHALALPTPYDPERQTIAVGLYHNEERLKVLDSVLPVSDDAVILTGTLEN